MDSLFLIVLLLVWAFQEQISDLIAALTERIRQSSKGKDLQ